MLLSLQGESLIHNFEGFRPDAYQDVVGIWTIGFGETLLNGRHVQKGDTITLQDASQRFRDRVTNDFIPGIQAALNSGTIMNLKSNQIDALVSLTYNIGVDAFKNSTLAKLLNQNQFNHAAEQFTVWNRAGGVINTSLLARRTIEMRVFLVGY